MVSLYQIRSIFLVVRGIDRTGSMFRAMDKNTKKAIETQLRLQRVFSNLIFVGAAMLTFGSLVALGIGKIMQQSALGSMYIADLMGAFERFGIVLGEVLTSKFAPWITAIITFMDTISQDTGLMSLIGDILFWGVAILIVVGAFNIIFGVIGSFITNIGILIQWLATTNIVLFGVKYSLLQVATAYGIFLGGFLISTTIFSSIVRHLSDLELMFLGVATAVAAVTIAYLIFIGVLTGGLALVAVGAAIGALIPTWLQIIQRLSAGTFDPFGPEGNVRPAQPDPSPYEQWFGRLPALASGLAPTGLPEGFQLPEQQPEVTEKTYNIDFNFVVENWNQDMSPEDAMEMMKEAMGNRFEWLEGE